MAGEFGCFILKFMLPVLHKLSINVSCLFTTNMVAMYPQLVDRNVLLMLNPLAQILLIRPCDVDACCESWYSLGVPLTTLAGHVGCQDGRVLGATERLSLRRSISGLLEMMFVKIEVSGRGGPVLE